MSEPRCALCGLRADALIHAGDHPERCHRFTLTLPEPETTKSAPEAGIVTSSIWRYRASAPCASQPPLPR